MDRTEPRRFTLLDVMLVVAMTAAAFAYSRSSVASNVSSMIRQRPDGLPWNQLHIVAVALTPIPTAWTLCLLPARLRSPRPPARRLWRQPGFLALVVPVPFILLNVASVLVIDARAGEFPDDLLSPNAWGLLGAFAADPEWPGVAVAAAWLQLAASRRWRAEPTWIDRAGRFLGCAWITLFLLQSVGTMLMQYD